MGVGWPRVWVTSLATAFVHRYSGESYFPVYTIPENLGVLPCIHRQLTIGAIFWGFFGHFPVYTGNKQSERFFGAFLCPLVYFYNAPCRRTLPKNLRGNFALLVTGGNFSVGIKKNYDRDLMTTDFGEKSRNWLQQRDLPVYLRHPYQPDSVLMGSKYQR